MGKQIKRKLASIVLAVAMLVTLLPTGVMADYYDNGNLSMSVDHQYDYDSYDTYYAYTNHSFDCSFYGNYYRDDTVKFKVYLDNEDITSKYGVESNDSSLGSISIPQEVISKYDEDSTHTITYGFYDENRESDCKEEKTITVKKPHFKYSLNRSGGEYVVGSNVLWVSSLADLGSCEKYDWDNPTGQYTNNVVATYIDVINDDSTPLAFVYESGNTSVVAKKAGHAIVKVYYSKLDGYEDDNPDGYCSLDFTAKDEIVNFNITSDLKDTSTVVPGTEFNLKANAESNMSTDNGGSCTQESERNITYKWYVDQNKSQGVTVTTDEKDSSVCHVKVANNTTGISQAVYLTYSYVDSEGNVQSNSDNPLSYCFTIEDSYYTLECEGLPETLAVGDKVVVTPVLKRISSGNKEEEVKDADIYCSWQTSSVDVVAMPDGKFEITRNSDDYVEFDLGSRNYNIYKQFNFNYNDSNQYVGFVEDGLSYDGINDVKLCLNMERVTVPYDCVSLYSYTYNNNGESQKVLINSSQYTSRTCGNVIYYSLSSKWLRQNINSGSINIEAIVSNKGEKVASNSAVVNRFYGTEPFKIFTMSNLVNCNGTLSGSGVYYFDNKGYYCVLDSLKEEGNNIMKITNNDGYWQYCPIRAGTTQVNAYYHYYKDGKRVDAVTTTALDIKNSYTNLWLESDGSQYKFAGNTYYYKIHCQQISYDKNGVQQSQDIDSPYSFKCDFMQYNPSVNGDDKVDLNVSIENGSRIKLDISKDSCEGQGSIYVSGYDSDGKEILSSSTYIQIYNKPQYRAYINGMYFVANWKATVMPSVTEYSKDNPTGKDVSSEYNLTVEPTRKDVTDITRNKDGSVTMCNKSDKRNEQNDIEFIWTPKVSDGRETLKQTYSMNAFSYDEADQTIQAQQSVTLIDNNTLGLNIYWTAKDSLYGAVKYSVEGEPYNTWYQNLESSNVSDDDGLNHYKTTLKLGAAQLAKNIKIQLVMRPGHGDDVIKEFTTSVASYTKKLLDSSDASYAKYKPLLKSMLNYGAAAQSYFGYDTKKPANSCLADKDKTIGDIPKKDIDRFNINKKFHIKGLTYYGTSLVLGDKVTMRHYFKLEEGRDISNYYANITKKLEFPNNVYSSSKCKFQKKGDLYYIETTDSFKSIFERPTIYISDGNNSEYFMYSPMNYVAKAYIKGNMKPELKKLINSMYWMETEKNKLV